jgi:NAD(P)-dependent dehydrogenase (short-subunit alcohol dehydrogenase family)
VNALVTGGGRGVGANIARGLAAAGWHVTVTGRTAEQVAKAVQEGS